MRFLKNLGLMLIYLGLILALLGLLAMVLPGLQNEQIQLILASFEAPAANPVLGFVNQQFLAAIRDAVILLAVGSAMVVLGGGISLAGRKLSRKGNLGRPAAQKRHGRAAAAVRHAAPLPTPPENPESKPPHPLPVAPKPPPAAPQRPAGNTLAAPEAKKQNPYRAYGRKTYAPTGKVLANDIPVNPTDTSPYQRPQGQPPKAPPQLEPPEPAMDQVPPIIPQPENHGPEERDAFAIAAPSASPLPGLTAAVPFSVQSNSEKKNPFMPASGPEDSSREPHNGAEPAWRSSNIRSTMKHSHTGRKDKNEQGHSKI